MNKRKSDSRRFYDSLKSLKLTKFTSFAWKTTQPWSSGKSCFPIQILLILSGRCNRYFRAVPGKILFFQKNCFHVHRNRLWKFLSDNWKKINTVPVCFGARNDSYGTFHITESGLINTFKLVHINGSVLCSEHVLPSYWGCNHTNYGNTTLLTVITFQNRTALWLADYKMGEQCKCKYSYGIKGTGVNATELVFNELPSPISAFVGQEFQIWFGQDLANCTEDNNSGQTCVDVYALYASTR